MNLLAAGARSCAGAIFFTVAMAAAQTSPTPPKSEQARKAEHRAKGRGAEAALCKRCSNDNAVPSTPPPSTPAAPPQKPDLKSGVLILEANDKNEISLAEPLGAALHLTLFVKEPLLHQQGELRATTFISQGEQQSVGAATKIQLDPNTGLTDTPVSVDLSKQGTTPFTIYLERLRPGKIYKGQLILTASGLINQWNVTLTTERGVLAVDPIGTLKFVKLPWKDTGEFLFTLYDKGDAGPYHHLRVRFEPPTGTNSKAITSNFSLDKLSFRENGTDIDLARRGPKSDGTDESALTLTKARTFLVHIGSLSPGEYSGALHFAADETPEDAPEAKLPLLIQVRHNVLIPVLVIFLSSLLGWFGSRYLVGVRRSRVLLQQIKALRERADTLGRRETLSDGWRFPSESTSLGFARLIVELSLLGKLAHSVWEVVFHGDEIDAGLKLAEQRLAGLELLRRTRLRAQPRANGRPAAQQAIGTRLRDATNLLDCANFTEVEQASLKEILQQINCWLSDDTLVKEYQNSLLTRLQRAYPSSEEIKKLPASSDLYARLDALIKKVPAKEDIEKQSDPGELKSIDEKITWVMILWRERNRPWAGELAKIDPDTSSLDDLFYAVDKQGWEVLKQLKSQLRPNQVWPSGRAPQTYEVVEIKLGFESPSGFDLQRLRFHPSQHVQWKISEETRAKESGGPAGTPEQLPRWRKIFRRSRTTSRDVETDSFTLVQYFLSAGKVKVTATATLLWRSEKINETIDIDNRFVFKVKANPEYGKKWQCADFAAVLIASLFAIATAIGAQYDSTFGSWNQYFAIFIWAIGAAAGGNLFTQLGATSTPGGAASTLK